jgi:CRP/FNR family transcriptional regulator, dissimilatory nitrate respiration regulator
MENAKLLQGCQLCTGLSEPELQALARIATIRRLDRDEVLFQEGDPGLGFYVLLDGRVRVYKASPDGKEYTLHMIRPGQMFAEVAIFMERAYPANCAAAEDSTVAFFPREGFLKLVHDRPQITLKIIASLAHFVREFNRMVEELSLKEVPARLAAYLLDEARKQGGQVAIEGTKAALANRLGTVSETLSRNLTKMKNAGLIREEGKGIRILDPERLFAVAEGLEKL